MLIRAAALLLGFSLWAVPQPAASPEDHSKKEYSLPPDKLAKAIDYSRARNWLHFSAEIANVAVLGAILVFGISAKFRDWAESVSKTRFVQALIFVPLLALANDLLMLPFGLYGQHLELLYEQSVQSWPSWFWDWTKGELLGFALAIILAFILYSVIRISPRRWWFYFWLATLPIIVTLIFLVPFLIEPLFFKFEPLSSKHPALVAELEKVVARGGIAIPPERMFEMEASEKYKSLNAYVTGIGASKRVVVWDTTIQKMTTPEILTVFGHEMGHYVLNHVRNTVLFLAVLLLILLYVGYRGVHWMLGRWGDAWRIRAVSDWASLPVLLLIAAVSSFVTEPVVNGYSRAQEHQADVYGLEVVHGLIPDSKAAAVHAFQVLGEEGLDEPNPNAFIEFWLYTHPSVSERIAFTESYDPWSSGTPKYVK